MIEANVEQSQYFYFWAFSLAANLPDGRQGYCYAQ